MIPLQVTHLDVHRVFSFVEHVHTLSFSPVEYAKLQSFAQVARDAFKGIQAERKIAGVCLVVCCVCMEHGSIRFSHSIHNHDQSCVKGALRCCRIGMSQMVRHLQLCLQALSAWACCNDHKKTTKLLTFLTPLKRFSSSSYPSSFPPLIPTPHSHSMCSRFCSIGRTRWWWLLTTTFSIAL